jgi:shikimate dehydrogenase
VTKIRLDVVGDPIDHSKSPLIHETVLESLHIPYEYRKVRVEKGHLPEYLAEASKIGIGGFNLTMPHKQDILPYLDFIDDEARIFNSVNTVYAKDGKLYGYNTDGRGFVYAMSKAGHCAKDKSIVILGAGGVVSTIAFKMGLEQAKKVTILNRTLSAAQKIVEAVTAEKSTCKTEFYCDSLTFDNIAAALTDCDILVNGTPLGMEGVPHNFEDLSFLDLLKKDALVYDLIYNPFETALLKKAKSLDIDTLNGFGMLVYQGLLADEIFLNRSLKLEEYKDKIENKLKNLKNF